MAFKKGESGNPKGRPKNAKNKTTIARQEAAKRAIEADATPLDVLTAGMRHHYDRWRNAELKNPDDLATACEFAAKAAPYVHPRLASTDTTLTHDVTDPLMELLQQIDGRTQALEPVRQQGVADQQPVRHNGQGRA